LRRRSVFSLRKLGDAIDKRLIRAYVFRPETVKSSTQIRFWIKLSLCVKLLRQIAHANWAPRHKADSKFFAGVEQSILFRVTVHERILCLERCDGLNSMSLRANIDETVLPVVITEQGENRNQCEEQRYFLGFSHGFACR